jgi:carbamate kinase
MAQKISDALSFLEKGGQSIIPKSKKLENRSYGTKITVEYDEKDLHKYDNVQK